MKFEMNEYFAESGVIKQCDILGGLEAYEESVFGDPAQRQRKKDMKKMFSFIRDAMLRIMQEMGKLFPRNATVFSCLILKKNGKWIPETVMYMTRDLQNETPIKESAYQRTFNISKEQLAKLKDVCTRSMEYLSRNTILDSTDYNAFSLNVFYNGQGYYRFGHVNSVSKNKLTSELNATLANIPESQIKTDLSEIIDITDTSDFDGLI